MDSNTINSTLINSDSSSATSTPNYSRTYATISSSPPKRRAGRTKFRETRHPLFKGVRQRGGGSSSSTSSGGLGPAPARWVCELREPNKKSRLWLGTFPTAEMAARAHDVAAMALRGSDACLNFADSAWRLPIPESSGRKEIQRAAAAAAEMFRPTTSPAADSDCGGQEKQSEIVTSAAADSEVGPITSMFDLMMDIEFWGDYYYWDHAIKEAAAGMMGNSTSSGINNNNNTSIICCSDDWDVESNSIADEVFLWNYSF